MDKHLNILYPNIQPVQSFNFQSDHLKSNAQLDPIKVFERSEPTPHYLLMTYGLSEIYYNENSHENEISKFGFELILRIDQIQILD
ncbi:hypothetical protein B9T35_17540 [Acinetobacter sp. ANC 3832]|nr:hypothetical protein B9T35_17540 [Acinetobacter sp. ANC 3832]